jgi:hypothetical protein
MNTTENKTYNGWTNYATWRIMLEIFDGGDFTDLVSGSQDQYDLANILREYVEEIVGMNADQNGLAYSYALSFLSDVNYYEIAESLIQSHSEV